MHQLIFYVPESHLEIVKNSLFKKGAGKIGAYDSCSWECKGVGQFRPLESSNPYLGSENKLEQVEEYRVEMVCEDKNLKAVLEALIDSHPYETPAYSVYPIYTLDDLPQNEDDS